MQCGTRLGVQPSSTCVTSRAPPSKTGWTRELSHGAFPQKTQIKGVFTSSFLVSISFFFLNTLVYFGLLSL